MLFIATMKNVKNKKKIHTFSSLMCFFIDILISMHQQIPSLVRKFLQRIFYRIKVSVTISDGSLFQNIFLPNVIIYFFLKRRKKIHKNWCDYMIQSTMCWLYTAKYFLRNIDKFCKSTNKFSIDKRF